MNCWLGTTNLVLVDVCYALLVSSNFPAMRLLFFGFYNVWRYSAQTTTLSKHNNTHYMVHGYAFRIMTWQFSHRNDTPIRDMGSRYAALRR